ncbi:MAG: hypothetical protein ABGY24_14705, partial [bacterium]
MSRAAKDARGDVAKAKPRATHPSSTFSREREGWGNAETPEVCPRPVQCAAVQPSKILENFEATR